MSLFKKPNRKFRQRETTADSDDESPSNDALESKTKPQGNVTKSSDTARSTVGISLKEEKLESIVPKPSKLLSFHDEEEEGEVFKLRKSSYSRRLAKQREKERRKLQENAPSIILEKETNKDTQSDTLYVSDKSSDKKPKESFNILSGKDAENMDIDSDEEREKNNPFKNVLQSGIIPDAATIYAMKKHRQMAREMGDFIPVEDPEKADEEKSRLVRDDDNDRSDDEDDEPSRLNFTINTDAVERQKIRETFLSLQDVAINELENEDAAELDRWEREQIKKGVGVTQVGPLESSHASESPMFSYPQADVNVPPYVGNTALHGNNQSFPSELLRIKELNLTTEDIKARIEERLNTLKTLHQSHKDELQNCERQLIEASELIVKLEDEAPIRERNFALYQQMSGYVRDLVECFDMKSAHIDLLDGRMVGLYELRAQKLAARHLLDVRDQSDEFSALAGEILRGINAEYLSEKHACTDEAKLRRAAEREGRRMRRRKRRERLSLTTSLKHQDGMSSDDEEADSDILKFKELKDVILREAETIFEDVVEDFGTLEGVMSSFENWKSKQLTSYCEAYVPLCLPKVFGVFVKLALLDWNPLLEERYLEKTNWFKLLAHYGLDFTPEGEVSDDPDANMLPGIMEKVVLLKVTVFIQKVWNPLSSSETSKLIHLIQTFIKSYPTINGKSKHLQNCLKAVVARIGKAIDEDVFIPMYPKELLENRSLGASDFFQRQFWSAVKLMQNVMAWDGIAAETPLQQMALALLLNRYLLIGLNTSMMLKDTMDKCKTIVSSIPNTWIKNAKGGSTLHLLKPFSAFLVKYADSNHAWYSKKGLPSEEIKDMVKDVVQLLVLIESLDEAVCLAKKYSVSAFKH